MKTIKLPTEKIDKFFRLLDNNSNWIYNCDYYKRYNSEYGYSKREVFVRRCWKLFSKYLNNFDVIGIMQEDDDRYNEESLFCNRLNNSFAAVTETQDYIFFAKHYKNLYILNTPEGNYNLKLEFVDLLSKNLIRLKINHATLRQSTFYDLSSEYKTMLKFVKIRNFMNDNLNTKHHYELKLEKARRNFNIAQMKTMKKWTQKKQKEIDKQWNMIKKDKEQVLEWAKKEVKNEE